MANSQTKTKTFQDIILTLDEFWKQQGCVLHHSYDLEVGAGTFNPATFIRALGPEPYKAAYTEASRRPTDGRYGENPNRLQHYFQYQIILKPVPADFLSLYFKSLKKLGIDGREHDLRLVHDDWQSPTLGAAGMGWEVWLNGMEITQITYFQKIAGMELPMITGELTYGLERLAMFLQGVPSVYDIRYNDPPCHNDRLEYGDIYQANEKSYSRYNFEEADVAMYLQLFKLYEAEAKRILAADKAGLALPGYDLVIKCSHIFNMLDARSAISVTERTTYIARIRALAVLAAKAYLAEREQTDTGYPLLTRTGGGW